MMRLRALIFANVAGLGLAIAPAPALAQQQAQPRSAVLPSNPQDFQCFALMQQRRAAYIANPQAAPANRAELINNLTIISAFYAGRLTHYPAADAAAQFASARSELAAATPQQRDAFAGVCTQFYLTVMDALINPDGQPQRGQQSQQPR
ncbi:hypothetical protein [Aurantiacibacter spongiae]|uniref:TIGR02301 family protein n=1 Tax=Aurantiacibacter spongiae TaxID=2488860 RepID=A0A3N5DF97_9SPHN|nr:hypothetical protein [Aurantiacibacter spongiae]RPF70322.1 hypothetical protein EG799_00765 [Aurantiacibacter spongiae]